MKCIEIAEFKEIFESNDEILTYLETIAFESGAGRQLFVDLDAIDEAKDFKVDLLDQWEAHLSEEGEGDNASGPIVAVKPLEATLSLAGVEQAGASVDSAGSRQESQQLSALRLQVQALTVACERLKIQVLDREQDQLFNLQADLEKLQQTNQILRDDKIAARQFASGAKAECQAAIKQMEALATKVGEDTGKVIEKFYAVQETSQHKDKDWFLYAVLSVMAIAIVVLALR